VLNRAILKQWWPNLLLLCLAGFIIWGLLNIGSVLDFGERGLWAIRTWRHPEQAQSKSVATPEATLVSLIKALRSGDITSASSYFIPSEQNNWFRSLEKLQQANLLGQLANELEEVKSSHHLRVVNSETANYSSPREESGLSPTITLRRVRGSWLIENL